jgi:hypothetical protein
MSTNYIFVKFEIMQHASWLFLVSFSQQHKHLALKCANKSFGACIRRSQNIVHIQIIGLLSCTVSLSFYNAETKSLGARGGFYNSRSQAFDATKQPLIRNAVRHERKGVGPQGPLCKNSPRRSGI